MVLGRLGKMKAEGNRIHVDMTVGAGGTSRKQERKERRREGGIHKKSLGLER